MHQGLQDFTPAIRFPHFQAVWVRDWRTSPYLSLQGLICEGWETCWKALSGSVTRSQIREQALSPIQQRESTSDSLWQLLSDRLELLESGSAAFSECACIVFWFEVSRVNSRGSSSRESGSFHWQCRCDKVSTHQLPTPCKWKPLLWFIVYVQACGCPNNEEFNSRIWAPGGLDQYVFRDDKGM